jgi:hypothetical protein
MRAICSIIKRETDEGKKFTQNIDDLVSELKLNGKGEKLRKYKILSGEDIKNHTFLENFLDFMKKDDEMREMYDWLKLKRVFIGNFGRKTGFTIRPIKEQYFRIVIHLGTPEVYFLDSNKYKDMPLVLKDGFGYIISPQESETTNLTVYEDPIRIIYDQKAQNEISKIRPKDYSRLTLVYDYEYEIPESYLKSLEEEEKKDDVEEKEEKDEEVEEEEEEEEEDEEEKEEENKKEKDEEI